MTASKFYNKNGTLTQYALACGYVEFNSRDALYTKLYHDGCCYHVITVDYTTLKRRWESFPTLTEARKGYREHLRLTTVKENFPEVF